MSSCLWIFFFSSLCFQTHHLLTGEANGILVHQYVSPYCVRMRASVFVRMCDTKPGHGETDGQSKYNSRPLQDVSCVSKSGNTEPGRMAGNKGSLPVAHTVCPLWLVNFSHISHAHNCLLLTLKGIWHWYWWLTLPWSESICWALLPVLLQRDIRQRERWLEDFLHFYSLCRIVEGFMSKHLKTALQTAKVLRFRATSCAGCTCTCSGRLQHRKRSLVTEVLLEALFFNPSVHSFTLHTVTDFRQKVWQPCLKLFRIQTIR